MQARTLAPHSGASETQPGKANRSPGKGMISRGKVWGPWAAHEDHSLSPSTQHSPRTLSLLLDPATAGKGCAAASRHWGSPALAHPPAADEDRGLLLGFREDAVLCLPRDSESARHPLRKGQLTRTPRGDDCLQSRSTAHAKPGAAGFLTSLLVSDIQNARVSALCGSARAENGQGLGAERRGHPTLLQESGQTAFWVTTKTVVA